MASDGRRTTFRKALQIALAEHFKAADLPVVFQAGIIDGPQPDRDIGCVWFDSKRPSGRDGNNEACAFGVRVLRLFQQDQGGASPREEVEARLERTCEILEDALRAVLTKPLLETASGLSLAGWASFFTVTQVVLNRPEQYVQASLVAWARNRTARGG